jgi:hypothetical protein
MTGLYLSVALMVSGATRSPVSPVLYDFRNSPNR